MLHPMGVIHGRFQVLHLDHLRYVKAGKARCQNMVIGIANPDPTMTREDPSDPGRSHPLANPLTYFERAWLLRQALVAEGVPLSEFAIVPFPINLPELLPYYVPMDAIFYLTIYDSWGRRKLNLLNSMGLRTEVLWERPANQKGISGKEVRDRMLRGEPWEHLVPESTIVWLKAWEVPRRLRRLAGLEES